MPVDPGSPEAQPPLAPPPGGTQSGPKPPPGKELATSPATRLFSRSVMRSQSGAVMLLGIASLVLALVCGIGVILAVIAIAMSLLISDQEKEDPSRNLARRTGLTLSIIGLVVGGLFLIGFVSAFM